MTITLAIQARLGSKRIPRKALRMLHGRPLFENVFNQARGSRRVTNVVLTTSLADDESALIELAEKCGAETYRAPVDDIVARLHLPAVQTEARFLVRVWGDCPFICPDVIDAMIEQMEKDGLGFITNADAGNRSFPAGLDIEIFASEVLAKMNETVRDPKKREFPIEYVRNSGVKWDAFQTADKIEGAHLTVDYEEDLAAAERILPLLKTDDAAFTYRDLLRVAKEHPALFQMFSSSARNTEYKNYLQERSK